jgi:hypothetical protein
MSGPGFIPSISVARSDRPYRAPRRASTRSAQLDESTRIDALAVSLRLLLNQMPGPGSSPSQRRAWREQYRLTTAPYRRSVDNTTAALDFPGIADHDADPIVWTAVDAATKTATGPNGRTAAITHTHTGGESQHHFHVVTKGGKTIASGQHDSYLQARVHAEHYLRRGK